MLLIKRCVVQSAACLFTAGLAVLPAGAQALVVDGASTRVEKFLQGSPIITSEDYPIESRIRGHGGVAEITLSVDFQGKPVTCIVSKSTGYPLLDKTTCRLYLERARYNLSENIENISSKFSLPIEAEHEVRWATYLGESRPLMYDVRFLEEVSYDNTSRTCKFSDGYNVRVTASEPCTKNLVKEPYMVFNKKYSQEKSVNLNIMEIYKQQSDAGNATSSLNLALLQARFGYEQWSSTMKTSADQGATLGAHYMCVTDIHSMNELVSSEARFKYCKQAYLGGLRESGNILGQIIAEDKTLSSFEKLEKIRFLDNETIGRFKREPLAMRATALAYLDLGNEEQAFLYLYYLVLTGDVISRKYLADLLSKPKGKYFNSKANEIWFRAYTVAQERIGNKVSNEDAAFSLASVAKIIIEYCDTTPLNCDDGIDASFKKSALELSPLQDYIPHKTVLQVKIEESDYPRVARKNNITGNTRHVFRVNENGLADECYTVESNLIYSTDFIACKRIAEGVRIPATYKDKPIPEFRGQPVRWSLRETKQNNSPALGALFLLIGIILR